MRLKKHISMIARQKNSTPIKTSSSGRKTKMGPYTSIKDDRRLLKENHFQRLDMALTILDAGLWDIDLQSKTYFLSDEVSTMLGYSPEEFVSSPAAWAEIVHPNDKKTFLHQWEAIRNGDKETFLIEYQVKAKNGDWRWISSKGRVVRRGSGQIAERVIGLNLDIDERKKNEIELLNYRAQLKDMAEERTRELKEAQDDLVNKAIESGRVQLSAMILHNIGNALTPLSVQLESLGQDDFDQIFKYVRQCYDDLVSNQNHLTDYVNSDKRGIEVFSYLGKLITALESNRKDFLGTMDKINGAVSYVSEIISLQQNYAAEGREHKQLTDINHLLDDAVKMQATSLEKRGIEVVYQKEDSLPRIKIDKNKLMQVAVNLIKNSYEAIDERGTVNQSKQIIIRSFLSKSKIGFEIKDNGIGIETDRLDKVTQFGESGKGSSGFGLYYCNMFVESNQGQLTVSSEGINKGASVIIAFNKPV